ncbi:MAG: PEP/pyruvate-binding domain-containing protein [Candidatus Limnocylindrales bacterium]
METLGAEKIADIRVIPLKEAGGMREVGGKASRLAALMASGERVPDGFCVIGSGERAVALALEAYQRMEAEPPVAVRSSASAEDGSEASFAGQFDTVLNVEGDQGLAAALATCWRSLSADRVGAYLKRRGLEGLASSLTMSVLVQRMVPARVAGVAFSADPLLGDRNSVVIHAVRGLGDALVSGEVSPDRYRVNVGGETEVEAAVAEGPVLTNDQAMEIAAMVGRIAEAEGTPQDVEWAIDSDGLWLLQARPMTALPPEVSWLSPIPGANWIKDLQAAEWATEPLSPLGATTTFETMAVARERYRGWPPIPKSFEPGHMLLNGWLYMRIGGPMRSFMANIAGYMVTLLTVGLDGHRRAQRRWGPPLAELDERSHATPGDMDVVALRRHAGRLLEALGWWWIEISYFASLVRVGQMMVGRHPGLTDPGALFRGNDSQLLESERALRRAAQDPSALATYVTRFGHTVESADPIHPTLAESPEVQQWQLAAARADSVGPDVRLARLRAERAQAEHVVQSIKGPRGYVARRALAAGQSHAAHTDDAVFHFQRVLALLRAAYLAQGKRLAEAGVLTRAEDVFYLEASDVWSPVGDQRAVVEARQALRDGQRKLSPPPIIPPPSDPSWASDRLMKMMPPEMRAQLLDRGLQVRDGRRVVVGSPASPGIAHGLARVVAGPDDFGRFKPGDVLVTHATSPIWTPLLAIAAAAITEVGGPFAHAAIVAREFGIPLVDGALDATKVIPDGALVVVNGSTGVVEL